MNMTMIMMIVMMIMMIMIITMVITIILGDLSGFRGVLDQFQGSSKAVRLKKW